MPSLIKSEILPLDKLFAPHPLFSTRLWSSRSISNVRLTYPQEHTQKHTYVLKVPTLKPDVDSCVDGSTIDRKSTRLEDEEQT